MINLTENYYIGSASEHINSCTRWIGEHFWTTELLICLVCNLLHYCLMLHSIHYWMIIISFIFLIPIHTSFRYN